MIPVKLEIEGLYSYRERAVIDFARLTEGKLFGIFGAVGSGKSALLEAITFALYGKIERMGQSGRNYNMMNLQSDRLFIGFEFSAGHDHRKYKFEVRSSRNSKNFQKVGTYDRIAYRWSGTEWIPLPSNDASQILHLSYENFIKTIIIPQGKFQEFLHLKAGDRTQMLQELFELHRFDLAGPTKRLSEENEHALSRTQGSLQEVPEITEEELEKLEEKKGEQQKALSRLELRLRALEKQESELKQLKEIKDRLADVQKKLDSMKPLESKFNEREARLKRYSKVMNAIGEPLARQKDYLTRQAELEKRQLTMKSRKEPLEREISQLEQRYRLAEEAYEKREDLRSQAEELKTISEMIRLEQTLTTLDERLMKGNALLEKKQQEMTALKEGEDALERKVKVQREELPDRELLMGLRSWFDQLKHKEEALEESMIEQQLTQEKREKGKEKMLDWVSQPLVQKLVTGSEWSLESIGTVLEAAIPELKMQQDAYRKQSQDLQFQSGLASFAEDLVQGQPCPLCGATDHPSPFHSEGVSDKLEVLEQRILAIEGRLLALNELKIELHGWKSQSKEHRELLAKTKATAELRRQAVKYHLDEFNWEGFRPDQPEALEVLMAKERRMREDLGTWERELGELRRRIDKKQGEIDRSRTALNEIHVDYSTSKARFETRNVSLKHFKYEHYQERPLEEIQGQSDGLSTRFQQVMREYETVKSALETKRETCRTLEKDLEFGGRELKRIASELEQLDRALKQKMEMYQLRDLKEAEEILSWKLDPEKEEEEIRIFRKELESVRTERNTYQKQEAGRTYDPDIHSKAVEDLEQGKKLRSQLERDLVELKFKAKDFREKMAKRKALLEGLRKLQMRADNLKVLERLFRGSGFVNYVSTIYLRELCQRANVRFRQLTRHQMSLEIDEKNDFQVKDNLNGGRLRSVKTLSGGQTFQASLCLALALADSITHRVGSSQNFFFLDEGFGTLDRDTLALVFDTLKQLRKEKRIVGVISHVEEMQEEIDHSLLIRKDEQRGSLVRGSWESSLN